MNDPDPEGDELLIVPSLKSMAYEEAVAFLVNELGESERVAREVVGFAQGILKPNRTAIDPSRDDVGQAPEEVDSSARVAKRST